MIENRTTARLRAGDTTYGVFCKTPEPTIAEIAAMSGWEGGGQAMSERASESGGTVLVEARQRRILHWRHVVSGAVSLLDDSVMRQ